jgi:hypothetical protein
VLETSNFTLVHGTDVQCDLAGQANHAQPVLQARNPSYPSIVTIIAGWKGLPTPASSATERDGGKKVVDATWVLVLGNCGSSGSRCKTSQSGRPGESVILSEAKNLACFAGNGDPSLRSG